MSDKVSFGDVRRVLAACGFVQTPVKGNHVLFEHRPSGTLLAFRPHRPKEPVDPMTLSIVRKKLEWAGFLEPDEFDRAIREASSDGPARAGPKAGP